MQSIIFIEQFPSVLIDLVWQISCGLGLFVSGLMNLADDIKFVDSPEIKIIDGSQSVTELE